MCGRFGITFEPIKIKTRFHVELTREFSRPRYNIAPSQNSPVILNESPERITMCRWGLIPHWAKDQNIGYRMINARAETVDQKPAFKEPFRKHRCLVIADCFYEWKKTTDKKIPSLIQLKEREPFAFAGLYDTWKNEEGSEINSFSIITTDSNELVRDLHDRMPVILLPKNEKAWINEDDPDKLKDLLIPYPSNRMKSFQISSRINDPKNDSPDVIKPIKTLFSF